MDIVPINREHDRSQFHCGESAINKFLREGAFQDQKLRLSRTSILIDEVSDSTRILGFHTLVITTVDQDLIPGDRPRIKRKIPVILLGQLAVDKEFQGRNYGNWLLSDVETRVERIGSLVGVRCLMLDARTKALARWYGKHDFKKFPDSLRMFKDLPSIREIVSRQPWRSPIRQRCRIVIKSYYVARKTYRNYYPHGLCSVASETKLELCLTSPKPNEKGLGLF